MVSSTTPSSGEYLLEMSGINKSFPGVKALDNVNLKVRPHSIHALMGENGAGKSTLLKCLFGIYQKDSGTILFQGKEIDFHSACARRYIICFANADDRNRQSVFL